MKILGMLAVILGLAVGVPSTSHGSSTPLIRVGSLAIPHNVQMIQLSRFAAKYGLRVEWVRFDRYADTQLAVSRGDVQLAAAGYHTVTLDTAPSNIVLLAGGNSGAQSLVVRKGLQISRWPDLAGKRIGLAPNSGPDIQFRLSAPLNGLDPGAIVRVNFPTIGPATVIALRNGDIDGMLCWESWCAQAVVGGFGTYSQLDIGANPTRNANTLLIGNRGWVNANASVTRLLLKAYVEATEFYLKDQRAWIEAMQAVTGASGEILAEAMKHTTLEWRLYEDRLLATAKAYYQFGVSRIDMSERTLRLLDYSFLMKATGLSKKEVGGR